MRVIISLKVRGTKDLTKTKNDPPIVFDGVKDGTMSCKTVDNNEDTGVQHIYSALKEHGYTVTEEHEFVLTMPEAFVANASYK